MISQNNLNVLYAQLEQLQINDDHADIIFESIVNIMCKNFAWKVGLYWEIEGADLNLNLKSNAFFCHLNLDPFKLDEIKNRVFINQIHNNKAIHKSIHENKIFLNSSPAKDHTLFKNIKFEGILLEQILVIPIAFNNVIKGVFEFYTEENSEHSHKNEFSLIEISYFNHLKCYINLLVQKNISDIENKNIQTILNEKVKALDVSAIVAFTDARGKITYVNDKFELITGSSQKNFVFLSEIAFLRYS